MREDTCLFALPLALAMPERLILSVNGKGDGF